MIKWLHNYKYLTVWEEQSTLKWQYISVSLLFFNMHNFRLGYILRLYEVTRSLILKENVVTPCCLFLIRLMFMCAVGGDGSRSACRASWKRRTVIECEKFLSLRNSSHVGVYRGMRSVNEWWGSGLLKRCPEWGRMAQVVPSFFGGHFFTALWW